MNKEVGKVYTTGKTYVLCSGPGKSEKTFSGVVVKQTDETSDHYVGSYSSTWTDGVFKESDDSVIIDNQTWRLRYALNTTPNEKII